MHRIALASILLLAAPPVSAQSRACGNPADLTARLASEYRETVASHGIDAAGNLVLLFANPDTGTWTILVALPGGPACVVSSGEAWERVEIVSPPPGRPS